MLLRSVPNRHNIDVRAKLTAMEQKVAVLVARGWTNVRIANRLGIAPQTLNDHLVAAFKKLHVENRAELLVKVLASRRLKERGGEVLPEL